MFIEVWDIENETLLTTLFGHSSRIDDVQFSPDSTLILTSSFDETERLWDLSSGREVAMFSANLSTGFRHRRFTPDGRMLIGGFSSRADLLMAHSLDSLSASDEELLQMVHERVSRELTPEERRQYLHE